MYSRKIFWYFNDKYNLVIERDSNKIYFKLYKINEITLFCYKNYFTLAKIINQLKLNSQKYNNLKMLFKLFEENYYNNNIIIEINDNIVYLIIDKASINLIKTDLDINEIFSFVIDEIKNIKMNNGLIDSFFAIELFLNEIKNDINIKLNEEKKLIDSFQKEVLNDNKEIKESMKEINELKEKIDNFKKQREILLNERKWYMKY